MEYVSQHTHVVNMTSRLEELTATASCWSTNALAQAVEAAQEISRLRGREENLLARRGPASEKSRAAFQDWLNANNVSSRVHIQHVGDNGHGLVAAEDLKQGESFISIPYHLVLGTDVSQLETSRVKQWEQVTQDPLLSRFPSCMLALRVLAEACAVKADRVSSFEPYIAMLPHTFDIPLFYDPVDFEAIDGTELFEPSIKLLYNSIKQFLYLRRLRAQRWSRCPIPLEKFTLTNYFWALGCVLTRQNQVSLRDDAPPVLALIPGWDMCNHEPGDSITTYQDTEARTIVCQAKRDFQQGEQVTMFYGPRSNQDFLLYSGFVIEQNPHSRVIITVELDSGDPLVKIRRMMIQKEVMAGSTVSLADDAVDIPIDASNFHSIDLMRALQLTSLGKEGLTKALRASAGTRDKLFEWSDEERAIAKTQFLRGCSVIEDKYNVQATRASKATRGELFQRYFKSQASVIASACQSETLRQSFA